MESNRGDEWEEEKEYKDVHNDLGALAVSEDDKTGNQEYLVACILYMYNYVNVHVRIVDILSLRKYKVTFGKFFFPLGYIFIT